MADDTDRPTSSAVGGDAPSVDLSRLIAVLQNGVIATNNLNQTIAKVFPQGVAVTASAGAASGNYLTITASDGNTYKIALLNPA